MSRERCKIRTKSSWSMKQQLVHSPYRHTLNRASSRLESTGRTVHANSRSGLWSVCFGLAVQACARTRIRSKLAHATGRATYPFLHIPGPAELHSLRGAVPEASRLIIRSGTGAIEERRIERARSTRGARGQVAAYVIRLQYRRCSALQYVRAAIIQRPALLRHHGPNCR